MNHKQDISKNFMGINFKARAKNVNFWIQVFISIAAPVLAYTGLSAHEFSSWSILGNTVLEALQNPYLLGLIFVSLYNAISDPLTTGFTDSAKARTYNSPSSEKPRKL